MKKVLIALIPIIIIASLYFSTSSDSSAYQEEISEFREEKHNFFKTSQGSPFVQKNIAYEPVQFFPADIDFRVNATLEKMTSRDFITIANSDGSQIKYLKYAIAKFKMKGTSQQLVILKALGFGNQYLTAFADETSGISTYGGGRYLDVVIGKSDQVVLDFNKAYNPYCAYSEEYLCPLPPRENFLEIPIEAGEKDYMMQE